MVDEDVHVRIARQPKLGPFNCYKQLCNEIIYPEYLNSQKPAMPQVSWFMLNQILTTLHQYEHFLPVVSKVVTLKQINGI